MLTFIKVALAQGGLVTCTTNCGWAEFNELINKVIKFFLIISIPLAVVVIIYGGFLLMTSGGSEQRIAQGKQAILSAIIGLAIVFGSYIIITTILKALK